MLLGYHSEGLLDLNCLAELKQELVRVGVNCKFEPALESALKVSELAIKEFWHLWTNFSASKKEADRLFLASIEALENIEPFLDYASKALLFALEPKNNSLYKRVIKLLFLALNFYQGSNFDRASLLLCQYVNRAPLMFVKADLVENLIFDDQLPSSDVLAGKVLFFSQPSLEEEKDSKPQIRLISSDQINQILSIKDPGYYTVTICNSQLQPERQYVRTVSKIAHRDLVNVNIKDLMAVDVLSQPRLENCDLLLDFSESKHLTESWLCQFSSQLWKTDRRLVLRISLKQLVNSGSGSGRKTFASFFGQPLMNFKSLLHTIRFFERILSKHGYRGLVIEDYDDVFAFSKVSLQPFASVGRAKEAIACHPNKQKFSQAIEKRQVMNPLLTSLLYRTQFGIEEFLLIASDTPRVCNYGGRNMIAQISNKPYWPPYLYNFLNFLGCSLKRLLGDSPANGLLYVQRQAVSNPFEESIIANFVTYLLERSMISVIRTPEDLIKRNKSISTRSCEEDAQLSHLGSEVQFVPIILSEASQNNCSMCCALVGRVRAVIMIGKFFEMERQPLKVSLNLRPVYLQFKRHLVSETSKNYQFVRLSGLPGGDRWYDFYELLNNPFNLEVVNPRLSFVLSLHSSLPQNVELLLLNNRIVPEVWSADTRLGVIRKFVKSLAKESKDSIDVKNLSLKLIDLMMELKIRSLDDIKSFINLRQLKDRKPLFELVFLLLRHISSNFSEFSKGSHQFFFTQSDLEDFLRKQRLGPIVILTPEHKDFIKIGGLAVMIGDLITSFEESNETVLVIMPYFNKNPQGQVDYLKEKGVKLVDSLKVVSRGFTYEFGVHCHQKSKVTYYFLHNEYLFPAINESVIL